MSAPSPAPDPAPGAAPSHDNRLPEHPVAATIEELSTPALVPAQRRGLVARLARDTAVRPGPPATPTGGPARWFGPRAAVRWVTDTLAEVAPHVPVRDTATLRRHLDGLDGDALAERLIRNAAWATAGIGAASGGLVAVKWTMPPTLLSAPVLLGAETLAVVSIEVKLVGELHAAYRMEVPGEDRAQRATALLQSWARQRGLGPTLPAIGTATVLGTAARKQLADRLTRRFGSNLSTLGPLLTGAAVAAYLNRRATRALGAQIRADLTLGRS